MKKNKISIILIVGILIFVNLLSDQYYFRIDLTEDKQYTLSSATKDILKNIDEPITVKAYFSENLPSNVAQAKRDMNEYLTEYSRISNHNLVYKFIDPSSDEKLEIEAMQSGIRPVMINVREKDQVKQQKAFWEQLLKRVMKKK